MCRCFYTTVGSDTKAAATMMMWLTNFNEEPCNNKKLVLQQLKGYRLHSAS